MADVSTMTQAFEILGSAGLQPPEGVRKDIGRAVQTYALVLGDLTDTELIGAAAAYVRSGARFWPSAGELLARVPRSDDAGEVAWGEAWAHLEHVRRTTPGGCAYGVPVWYHADPAVDTAIRAGLGAIGGWQAYGLLEPDTEGTARAHFRDAYQAAQGRAKRDRDDAGTRRVLAQAGVGQIEQVGTWGRAGLTVLPGRVKS